MNPAAMGTTTPPFNSPNRRHLQRWNTTSTSAFNHRGFCSVASDDLELLPLKAGGSHSHTYSSLRDLLGEVKTAPPGSDICIRNRLVKQAARAYLSPMSDYPSSAGGNLFHRLWSRVAAFIHFFCTKLVRVRIQNVLAHTLNSS